MQRRGRPSDPLADGLTIDERVTRLETTIRGTPKVPGLALEVDRLLARTEALESTDRRRRMPWLIRWFLR